MHRLALALCLLGTTGCSRWAYAPTWRAVERQESVTLQYEGGAMCGDLSVTNDTKWPLTVAWSDVHARLPWGERRETAPWIQEGAEPPEDGHAIEPGQRFHTGLCAELHLFVVRRRPLTGWDGLIFLFGLGTLAGNVAWEPDELKRTAVLPNPEAYGWDLVVPMRRGDERYDAVLRVKGDEVTAFKYTPWAHGEPDPLEPI